MPKKKYQKNNSSDCRTIAAEILVALIEKKASLSTLLPAGLDRVPEVDRPLLQELCYGSVRHFYSLQQLVHINLSKPLKRKDNDVFALMIIGAYQLLYTRIPEYAAINSCVNSVINLDKIWAKGLVNAILRNIQRGKEISENNNTPTKNAEATYDHPLWMIKKIRRDYGDTANTILNINNSKAPLTLRVNSSTTSRSAYLEILKISSIDACETPVSPCGILLKSGIDVGKIPLFLDGAVSVQDEAAQLCAPLLGLSPGFNVLDACASPGGKTCHMLEMVPELKMVAIDINPQRTTLIEENLARLGLRASVLVADAAQPEQWFKKYCGGSPFDRILLDAPCSGTGVIRHHPDIKLLRAEEDIPVLATAQLKLLDALWPLLKPGGILLYTTCSILSDENDSVVSQFLEKTPSARIEIIEAEWGRPMICGRQLLPQLDGNDGFYFSRIRKIAI